MFLVSLDNRTILFCVGRTAVKRAFELEAGQLQKAACNRLLGQLNPLICQWVISGTQAGKATDSTGYTETTHIIKIKPQNDSSKQTCPCKQFKKLFTRKCQIFRDPSVLQMHLRLKCTFDCSKCEPDCCLFHTDTDRGTHTVCFGGHGGMLWHVCTRNHTHTHPCIAWKTL